MLITRTSIFTGIERTLDLPVTQEMLDMYAAGFLLQDAFPNLDPADREFIRTGITSLEWDAYFSEEEEVD